ncbi:MAG: hypothetical protein QME68_07530, partial [Elusimicrobiota bacterium]|nr:hypothetical protein [Elusimicrobiota bacterium]
KSKNFITIRPSGTSQSIRFYTQIYSRVTKDNIVEQKYRNFQKAENIALKVQKQLLSETGITKYIPSVEEQLKKLSDAELEKGKIVDKYVHEKQEARKVFKKLTTPLDANGNKEMAKRFLESGYGKDGYGVPEKAATDGSHTLEGNQGYYTPTGKQIFLDTVNKMKEFFLNRKKKLNKPIRLVIKPGIGGQHTPFQAIADVFQVIDIKTGKIVGEYELGKNFEISIKEILKKYNAGWDQIAVIPSSKSGSTDETMMVFVEIFYTLLKHISQDKGIKNGEKFADIVLQTLHDINFVDGKERPGKDLFKIDEERFKTNSFITLVYNAAKELTGITQEKVKEILGIVLGNMFFETTDRPEQSRLSAFIRNSGLDKELRDDAPGFGAMFDNVGGRWTADLHMMLFLAYYNLNAEEYWQIRKDGIVQVREGKHTGNTLGNKIVDEEITDIALVVPDEFFWFGKSIEQNFNESIWQEGFANLVTVKASHWNKQKHHYENTNNRLVINLSNRKISDKSFNVIRLNIIPANFRKLNKQQLANIFAELYTTFYGLTNTVGTRLIAKALAKEGFTADNVDLNNLANPATKIVQKNLFLLQPYVELGKGLLEDRLKALQEAKKSNPGAIKNALKNVQQAAKEKELL